MLISDEAHCHTLGFVKKQSMLYWAPLNPIEMHEEPFNSSKVVNGVLCRIVGQFLFENDKGETLTVTVERYIAILQNFLLPKLEAFGVLSNNLYFKRNRHSVHAARCIVEVFRYLFRRVISRFGGITQPAISPVLTVPDLTVYSNRPYTIQELKNAIRDEIATTNQELFL
jgi:hypothetical protein